MASSFDELKADVRKQMKLRPFLYLRFGAAGQVGQGFQYLALALAGEAGEAADVVKKMCRDGAPASKIEALKLELGDVLWYLAAWCELLDIDFDELARLNQEKLAARRAVKGNG